MPAQPDLAIPALAALGAPIPLDRPKTSRAERQRQKERRDVFAFWAVVVFAVLMYAVPADAIPELAEMRLVLITFIAAAGLMFLRRVFKLEPIFLDGWRGASLLGFAGLAVASVGWSVYPQHTQESTIELLKLVAIYFTMINVVTTPRRLVIVCVVLVLASIVPSIGAINWYRAGERLVEGFRTRWMGIYADPNYLAMDVGMAVPLAVAFITRRTWSKVFRILCAIAAVLAVIAIVLSHSRGGFLGLCTAMGVWSFREKQRLRAIFLGIAFVLGLVVFAPATYWQRNETIRQFHGEASAEGRIHAWVTASRISAQNPLLGVGAGGFIYAWPLYSPPDALEAPRVTHNVFLEIVAELGFAGLFLFLIFAGGAVAGAFSASQDPEIGWLSSAIAASVTGFLVCQMFLSGYLAVSHLYVLFALGACAQRIARTAPTMPTAMLQPQSQPQQGSIAPVA